MYVSHDMLRDQPSVQLPAQFEPPLSLANQLLRQDTVPQRHTQPRRHKAIMAFAEEAVAFLKKRNGRDFPWGEKEISSGFGYLLELWAFHIIRDALHTTHLLPLQIVEAPLLYDTPRNQTDQRGVDYFLITQGRYQHYILCGIDVTSSPGISHTGGHLFDPANNEPTRNGFKKHGELQLTSEEIIPVSIVSLHDLSLLMWQNGEESWGVYEYFLRAVAPVVLTQDVHGDFPYCHLTMDYQKEWVKSRVMHLLAHYVQEAYRVLRRDKQHYAASFSLQKIKKTSKLLHS